MRVTSTRLSDGRELRYYDFDGTPDRTAVDERALPAGSTEQGRMRWDAIMGEWVAVAGHRQTRIFLPDAAQCPICPTSPGNRSEIPEADYQVAVFENRFPSFLFGSGIADTDDVPDWGRDLPAHGRCEVVAFSDDHAGSIGRLTTEQMGLVFAAWQDRTADLAALAGIRYVFVFENRGAEVGVTLHHPHGQIYAYPYVPPVARRLHDQAESHWMRTHRRLLDDVVDLELESGARIVHRDEHWVVFVPYAARWPFELQIHPLHDRGVLTDVSPDEAAAFCAFYPRMVRALDTLFDAPFPYMSGWVQRPAHATDAEARDARLYLRLISNRRAADKLKYLAGSESLMGAFINDVTPEESAARIRAALESTS
jgi:UDPglucose--hexose-1-phosphate uridylyltransferase